MMMRDVGRRLGRECGWTRKRKVSRDILLYFQVNTRGDSSIRFKDSQGQKKMDKKMVGVERTNGWSSSSGVRIRVGCKGRQNLFYSSFRHTFPKSCYIGSSHLSRPSASHSSASQALEDAQEWEAGGFL